jgi:ATP-dependent RNA helicase RhlE
MNQGYIKLKGVEFFVLDEIDRMLDMGFIRDVRKIVSALPLKRQSLFFSATMSSQTGELAKNLLTDPVRVEAAPQASTLECIKQRVFFVDQNNKIPLLLGLLKQQDLKRALVFTRTKHRADKVALMLNKNRINADAIHGNKSQGQRTKAMSNFKSGHLRVLVATDIAARGIDIDDISHVVNFDLPNEPESYVHRIGRTGRMGAEGNAYSFCAADERSSLRDIERLTREKIEVMEHQYHSEQAKNAVGAAAKPTPKKLEVVQRSFGQKSVHRFNPRKSHQFDVAR